MYQLRGVTRIHSHASPPLARGRAGAAAISSALPPPPCIRVYATHIARRAHRAPPLQGAPSACRAQCTPDSRRPCMRCPLRPCARRAAAGHQWGCPQRTGACRRGPGSLAHSVLYGRCRRSPRGDQPSLACALQLCAIALPTARVPLFLPFALGGRWSRSVRPLRCSQHGRRRDAAFAFLDAMAACALRAARRTLYRADVTTFTFTLGGPSPLDTPPPPSLSDLAISK